MTVAEWDRIETAERELARRKRLNLIKARWKLYQSARRLKAEVIVDDGGEE